MKTIILALVLGLSAWLFSVTSASALPWSAAVTQALQWDHAMVFPQADTTISLFDGPMHPISMLEPFSSILAADLQSVYAQAEHILEMGAQDWTYLGPWFAGFENWTSAGVDEQTQSDLGDHQGLIPTPVPEPATLLLFGAGLICSAAIFRQKII
jgi:hypothetical protein